MIVTDHAHPIDAARVAHARSRLPNAEDAARLTGLLSLMADPVRIRFIYALDIVEELCVGDLALALDVSEDSVSYALRLLRTAGLVRTRKEGHVVVQSGCRRLPRSAARSLPTPARRPDPHHRCRRRVATEG